MAESLYFEDLKIGDCWTSRGRTVTETDIVNFACHTGDFDPLHIDHTFAGQSPFRKPIAHGILGIAWVAGLSSMYPAVNTEVFLAVNQWEFHLPIFVGDTLRVVNEVVGLEAKGRRRGQVRWFRKLMNDEGKTVQSGYFDTLVARRVRKSSTSSNAEPLKGPHLLSPKRESRSVRADLEES